MAGLRSWKFVLLTSAVVLASAISVCPVAAADGEEDKKRYEVTTVLDGNKLGLFFDNIYEDTIGGSSSIIALDPTRSSILRVSLPLSQSSVIERISGSPEGKPGYRDGSANEALFNHPRKLTLDSDGTIYVADPKNTAVRMITRAGLVTTIAGGSNRTGHNDGEGIEVTFSNDFGITYLSSTCTLAVADRGNRMIREIQLPQFLGRCGGATPSSPGSMFTSTVLLMSFLAGIVGIVAGVIGTILAISTQRLEQLQSGLCWVTTDSPSSSIWKKTAKKLSSTLQVKETTSMTRSSASRNAAVEDLVWSSALFMDIATTLFEKFLYALLYSLSLLLRLLCALPLRELFHSLSGTTKTVLHDPDKGNETDLLCLNEQPYGHQPSISPRNFSFSPLPVFRKVGSVRSRLIQRQFLQVKNFQLVSPQVKDLLILEDLIDFSEPVEITEGPEFCQNREYSTSTVGDKLISEAMPADHVPDHVVKNGVTIESMVDKCLAELAAPSAQLNSTKLSSAHKLR